jgi:hypothetical protein
MIVFRKVDSLAPPRHGLHEANEVGDDIDAGDPACCLHEGFSPPDAFTEHGVFFDFKAFTVVGGLEQFVIDVADYLKPLGADKRPIVHLPERAVSDHPFLPVALYRMSRPYSFISRSAKKPAAFWLGSLHTAQTPWLSGKVIQKAQHEQSRLVSNFSFMVSSVNGDFGQPEGINEYTPGYLGIRVQPGNRVLIRKMCKIERT